MRITYAATVLAFILSNVAVYAYYRDRPYPPTRINGIYTRPEDAVLPASIELIYKGQPTSIRSTDLGIRIDQEQTRAQLMRTRSKLPLANIFARRTISPSVQYDQASLAKILTDLFAQKVQQPVDAKITIQNSDFTIQDATAGSKPDTDTLLNNLPHLVAKGVSTITVPESPISPRITREQLLPELQSLHAQRATTIIYSYNGKTKQLSPRDITGWYITQDTGNSPSLSDSKIRSTIISVGSSFGIRVQNLDEAVRASKSSVQQRSNMSLSLVPVPVRSTRNLSYCTNVKGVDASHLAQLNAKLVSVYGDKRGWSLGGDVSFTRVTNGCDFTVWLSDASLVPSFGSICDTEWSCNVGRNVIINFDRWRYASTAWNNAGGSLEDYRVMVINHEMGHYLGFGHSSCGGTGQPAPVMLQQSINLQGCVFNIWPTAREISLQRASLGF